MARITISIPDEDLPKFDYICHHNCRTRPEQLLWWVRSTLRGEKDGGEYDFNGWFAEGLTDDEVQKVFDSATGPLPSLKSNGEVIDHEGNVIDQLTSEEMEAVRAINDQLLSREEIKKLR